MEICDSIVKNGELKELGFSNINKFANLAMYVAPKDELEIWKEVESAIRNFRFEKNNINNPLWIFDAAINMQFIEYAYRHIFSEQLWEDLGIEFVKGIDNFKQHAQIF